MQGPDLVDPHQAGYTMLAAGFPGFSKVKKDAWRTVDAVAGFERGVDLAERTSILRDSTGDRVS